MTQPKRPLKVFLCHAHAHADRDPVRTLYTRLTNDGVDAWLDKEKLLPGQDWELEIKKAVREADVVVVCLSRQFNQRGFRQKEVRLALDTAMEMPEGEIFIIPARLEECENLESLRRWHWVDLFEDDGYEMLIRALQARSKKIGTTLQFKKSWLPTPSSSRTTEIKNLIPRGVNPKTNRQLTYWLSSFVVLVLGIVFFSSLKIPFRSIEPTPDTNQPQIFPSPTYTETFQPSETPTMSIAPAPTQTLTPTLLPDGYALIPNVIGLKYSDAEIELNKLGFEVEYLNGVRPDVDAGIIIGQEPLQGSAYQIGEAVVLRKAINVDLLQGVVSRQHARVPYYALYEFVVGKTYEIYVEEDRIGIMYVDILDLDFNVIEGKQNFAEGVLINYSPRETGFYVIRILNSRGQNSSLSIMPR